MDDKYFHQTSINNPTSTRIFAAATKHKKTTADAMAVAATNLRNSGPLAEKKEEDLSSWVLIDIGKGQNKHTDLENLSLTFTDVDTADGIPCSGELKYPLGSNCGSMTMDIPIRSIEFCQSTNDKTSGRSDGSTPTESVFSDCEFPPLSICTTPESCPGSKLAGASPESSPRSELAVPVPPDLCAGDNQGSPAPLGDSIKGATAVPTHSLPYPLDEEDHIFGPIQSKYTTGNPETQGASFKSKLENPRMANLKPPQSFQNGHPPTKSSSLRDSESTSNQQSALNVTIDSNSDGDHDSKEVEHPGSPFPTPSPEAQGSREYKHLVECSLRNRARFDLDAEFSDQEKKMLESMGSEFQFCGRVELARHQQGEEWQPSFERNSDNVSPTRFVMEGRRNDGNGQDRSQYLRPCPRILDHVQSDGWRRRAEGKFTMRKSTPTYGEEGKVNSKVFHELVSPIAGNMGIEAMSSGEVSETSSSGSLDSRPQSSIKAPSPDPQWEVAHVTSPPPRLPVDVEATFEAALVWLRHLRQDWANLAIRTSREVPMIATQFDEALKSGQLESHRASMVQGAIEILHDISRKLGSLQPHKTSASFPTKSADYEPQGVAQHIQPSSACLNGTPVATSISSEADKDSTFRTLLYGQKLNIVFSKAQVDELRTFWTDLFEQRARAVSEAAKDDRVKEAMADGVPLGLAINEADIPTNLAWILSIPFEIIAAQLAGGWAPLQLDWFLEHVGVLLHLALEHSLGAADLEVRDDGMLDVKEEVRMARTIGEGFRCDMTVDDDDDGLGEYQWDSSDTESTAEGWSSDASEAQ
ncbi:hypothetical protein MKZ38_001559 [Zalerion maritima]|uniref:Uncharacterized protein n=1 Tax=Zalerion maritima TaxID=339359 RepID=A0AAD5RXT6_9PEZI|nr:hypothetical protein MKZ38_001559 [Zalerion maritima]